MPTVSVIVPNYNHALYLRKRIDSVLAQTYQDFELILLDDCSTDESRSILQGYVDDPRVRLEFNETNSGSPFKQWNKGVRLARGKYVWIAESDDYADERLLERLVGVLEEEPRVTFAYCRSWRIAANGEPNGYADWYLADLEPPSRWAADFRADGREECRRYFVRANTVPNASAVVFRKAIFDQVGGADESLHVCGDWKLWVSMALEGRIAYLGEPLNYYREHAATVRSKVQETGRGAVEHLGMIAWMLERVKPTEALREKAYEIAAYLWIPAVTNRSVPLRRRWALLWKAIAADHHAILRLFRPALHPLAESIKRLSYQYWIKRVEQRSHDPGRIAQAIASYHYQPKISVIMPVYNTPTEVLDAAIRSVKMQHYGNWELCICDDASPDARVRECLANWQKQDNRIMVTFSSWNEGISGASNRALQLASGEFVGLLDHDDELSPDALYEVVRLLQEHPEADMIYSNEDRLDAKGRRTEPFFKPDWSPEYMLSCMYTCHFGVYRKRQVDELGGFRAGFDGSQDYDLVLRLSERTNQIYHIPKILYHWRMIQSSASASTDAKPYAYVAARRALSEHLERRQIPGEIMDAALPGHYRVRFNLRGTEKVSIIVVASGRPGILSACITSIEAKTSYPNYEIVVAGNQNLDEDTRHYLSSRSHKVVSIEGPFNSSRLVNMGAKHTNGTHLVLLQDDVEVISADWIPSMLGFCRQEAIGVVGANLLRRDGNIQQDGVALGLIKSAAGHFFRKFRRNTRQNFTRSRDTCNCSAVSGACMMIRKSVFDEVGGFDERLSDQNDIDFCSRVREAGYRIVWTPWAEFAHDDSPAPERRRNSREVEHLEKRWSHSEH